MYKKIIALIMVTAMLFALAACGSSGPDVTGKYEVVSAMAYGEPVDATEEWIELKNGGKGTFYMGYEFDLKWSLDGEKFNGSVTFLGLTESCNGTLKDGVLTVTYGDWTYVMSKDGAAVPASAMGTTTTDTSNNVSTIAGYYPTSGVIIGGVVMSLADMESADMVDGTYLQLNADCTGEIATFEQTASPLTYDENEGKLFLDSGIELSFTVDGATISVEYVEQGMTINFTLEGSESTDTSAMVDSNTVNEPLEPIAEETLTGNWFGWVRESESYGEHEDDFQAAWGYVDYDSDGNKYFEVYKDGDPDNAYISMFIEDEETDKQIIPIIGEEDAWIMDTYLLPEEADTLTAQISDDGCIALTINYTCYDGESGCIMELFMRKDGVLWDENNDTMPPRYDEYKASIESEAATGGTTSANDKDTSGDYGKSNAEATGIVDFETLKAGFEWLQSHTGYESGYYKPTYEEVYEQFGVHGVKTHESSWDNDYHVYEWITANGDFVLLSFNVLADGSESWNSSSWSPRLNDE